MRGRTRLALICAIAASLTAVSYAPAAPQTTAQATVGARKHFFGADNVDAKGRVRRDRVILSWFSVASLAMAFDGHVVLLDT
jgi:hypothetical protein